MASKTGRSGDLTLEPLLADLLHTLRRIAVYRLPPTVDRRLLWLSENKPSLTPSEREELEALTTLAEERTLEKLEAQAVVKRLEEHFPKLVTPTL
jgi:hypothetical protein